MCTAWERRFTGWLQCPNSSRGFFVLEVPVPYRRNGLVELLG